MKLIWVLNYLYLHMKKVYLSIVSVNFARVLLMIWATVVLFTDWLTFTSYHFDAVADFTILFKFFALVILAVMAIVHW